MSILVTGCAGFIGSHVAELLIKQGYDVIGADNLNSAYDIRLKHWRLGNLNRSSKFEFNEVDVANQAQISTLMGQYHIDAVINLAARAGVRQSLADPHGYYATNLTGVLNLLEGCRENGVQKFVQASTSSVYGDDTAPFLEEAPANRPLSPYAASKKAAENLCQVYHHNYGIDVTVLRYFTVFGPGGRPDMAIFRFIKWIIEGESVVIYGDGTQSRDFTYVGDIARGTIAGLKPLGFEIVNLGADQPITVSDLISKIETLTERIAVIDRRQANQLDVQKTWAEIGKAKKLLGWEPEIDIDKGLSWATDWYRENQSWAKDIKI